MEVMAVENITSALKYLCSLSAYPIHRLVITSGRRSEGIMDLREKGCNVLAYWWNIFKVDPRLQKGKDTESENINAMNRIFIVMYINRSVTAEQDSTLTANLEERRPIFQLLLGDLAQTRVFWVAPFPVCAHGCPPVPWAGWCAACVRSSSPQVSWRPAARRVCRPGSGPQPPQGSPAGARRKYCSDTGEKQET